MLKQFKSRLILSVFLTAAFWAYGCAKQNPSTVSPIHAGAANSFDSATYDTLYSIQVAIEKAKVGVTPAMKPILNQVIAAYDIAQKAHAAYHAAATAGTATPAQQADVQAKVNTLQNGMAQLSGGK